MKFHIAVFVLALAPACAAIAQAADAAPAPAPIRAAIYDDDGSPRAPKFFEQVVGVDKTDFTLTHVSADEIRHGVLKNFDVLIQGGGGSIAQANSLEQSGRDAIREFVRGGGGYLGVCAGAYLAASDEKYELGIINARVVDRQHWARGRGDVILDFSKTGQQELKFPHDKTTVLYHQGPLLAPDNKSDLPPYTLVATFETEVAQKGAPHGVMQGTTAMASSTFGKGRVFVISPHPEQTEGLEFIVPHALDWVAPAAPKAVSPTTLAE